MDDAAKKYGIDKTAFGAMTFQEARKSGQWVVLAGHEMADGGVQTTRLSMLRKLIAYAQNPENKLWIAPVGTVATYIIHEKK